MTYTVTPYTHPRLGERVWCEVRAAGRIVDFHVMREDEAHRYVALKYPNAAFVGAADYAWLKRAA